MATVAIPSASLASQGRRCAYMRSARPCPEATRMQRLYPFLKTRLAPPGSIQCILTSPLAVFGVPAQKAETPCDNGNPAMRSRSLSLS